MRSIIILAGAAAFALAAPAYAVSAAASGSHAAATSKTGSSNDKAGHDAKKGRDKDEAKTSSSWRATFESTSTAGAASQSEPFGPPA